MTSTTAEADLYLGESKYEPAQALIQSAWETRKSILGPNHRKTLSSENLLANCFYSLNKYAEAGPLYQHVLEQRLAILGAEHADTANSYTNLAGNFYWSNQYEPAITNYRAGLAIRRKVLGKDHADTKLSIASLADALAAWAFTQEKALRWDIARKAREEVLALRSERYGEQDYRVVDARLALEDIELVSKFDPKKRAALAKIDEAAATGERLYYKESKNEPALVAGRTAWEGRKTLLGPEHRKSLGSENLVANCLYSLSQYGESEPLYLHVLEVRQKVLGEEHPDTASAHGNLARNYRLLSNTNRQRPSTARDFDDSPQSFWRSIERYQTKPGRIGRCGTIALAGEFEQRDRFEEARAAWEEAARLCVWSGTGPTTDAWRTPAWRWLTWSDWPSSRTPIARRWCRPNVNHQAAGKIYLEESVYGRAIVLVQAAWETRQKILGPEHRKTLVSENLLSNCLFSSYRYAECEPHYKHVLEARLALLGPEHIDVATSYNNLAKNFYWQQHYAEAVEGHRKAALAIRRKTLGDQATDTLSSVADLADALSELATAEERAEHLDAARPLLDEAARLCASTRYGADDYRVTDARLALADLDLLGKLTAAQRAEVFKADDAHAAASKLYGASKYDAALAQVQPAYEARKTILGPDHRKTLTSENLLANCLLFALQICRRRAAVQTRPRRAHQAPRGRIPRNG